MNQEERLLWPDVAKGFAITLVVLSHLTSKHYPMLLVQVPDYVFLLWLGVSDFLAPIRMPLFFAISGFFAARSLTKPWTAVWSKKILSMYYLYLLWYLIHFLFFQFGPPLHTSLPSGWFEFTLGIFWGYTSLWYLYALPVYFIVCKLAVQYRCSALLGACLLAVIGDSGIFPMIGNSASLVHNLFFYMFAAYFPSLVQGVANQARKRLILAIISFVVASALMSLATYFKLSTDTNSTAINSAMGILDLALGFLGIGVGIKVFNLLAPKIRGISFIFGYIGRNTLPIYVLHLPLLSLINLLFAETSMSLWVSLLYPFAALIGVILLCLVLYQILLFLKLSFLFQKPVLTNQRKREDNTAVKKWMVS